jgi:CBS domain-containing protein
MNRLSRIKAKDIMQVDVVKLDASASIESAIQTLEELEISGAPVLDESGRLVGVLTTSDVTRVEHVRSGRIEATRGEWTMSEPVGEGSEGSEDEANEDVIFAREDYSPALLGSDTVADWMNRRVVTVDPDASLKEVCRRMVKEHIHRVIVTTEKKVDGIITSFDIVRCVAEEGSP